MYQSSESTSTIGILYDITDITENSGLRKSGINLQATYGIDTGKKDFNQQPMLENGIGASF